MCGYARHAYPNPFRRFPTAAPLAQSRRERQLDVMKGVVHDDVDDRRTSAGDGTSVLAAAVSSRSRFPEGGVLMYRPHPFSWVPADGQRHATADVRPPGGFSTGLVVETLCGQQVQADNSDMA